MVHKAAVLFSVTDVSIMSMWTLNNTNEGSKKATPPEKVEGRETKT